MLERLFEDHQSGGYFLTGAGHEKLLAREKPAYDGAEPSGNSVEALNLLRLAEFTGDDRYWVRGEETLGAFGRVLATSPAALSEMLLAVESRLDTPNEVVVVAKCTLRQAESLLAKLRASYLPNRILVLAVEGQGLSNQARLVPLLQGKIAQGGRPTAYVRRRGACDLPSRDAEVFAPQLSERHQEVNGLKGPGR